MTDQEKKKILLIDDDTSLLVTLGDFLRFEGYDVITADSGEQGVKELGNTEPDLIILDMSMPGMGGIGFLKEISSEGGKPKYPVLVLTARANMAEFFADVDVDGFVAKPCEPNDLLMEVSRIIFLRSGTGEDGQKDRPPERRRLLLGEDDQAIARRLTEAFAQEGYLVDAVGGGAELLERAIVERPDAVVVKRMLSRMNGDAVAGMLREMPNTKRIPVILYEDAGSTTGKAPDKKSGVWKYVQSNDTEPVLAAVKQALAG